MPRHASPWVRHSRAFDYIERNIDPVEDFAPYFDLVERDGVPIKVFGGIFCAGLDGARMRWGIAIGGRLGARIFTVIDKVLHSRARPLSFPGRRERCPAADWQAPMVPGPWPGLPSAHAFAPFTALRK